MKAILNLVILLNTIYVIVLFGNSGITDFFLPACIYLVAIFLRINYKDFSNVLKSNHNEN